MKILSGNFSTLKMDAADSLEKKEQNIGFRILRSHPVHSVITPT
jgi:hypothetical protein